MKIIRASDAPAGRPDPLDDIAGEAQRMQGAAGADPEGQGGEGEAQAVPELTNTQCLQLGLEMVRDTACAVAGVSSLKRTMSAQAIQAIAEANGPLLDKYGISLSGAGAGYMVELRAAFVTVPVLIAAYLELRDEVRAMRAKPVDQGAPVEVEPATAPA